jgi:hypothetical protein
MNEELHIYDLEFQHEGIEDTEEHDDGWLAYTLDVDLALLMQDHLQLKHEKYSNTFIKYASHEEYDRAIAGIESQINTLYKRVTGLRG